MPIVCCLGEAAGNAAAIAVEDKCIPEKIDVAKLRKRLKENGATIF